MDRPTNPRATHLVLAGLRLAQAVWWLLLARISLLLLPFATTSRLQQRARRSRSARPDDPDPNELRSLLRAMVRATRLVPGSRCLAQALAGQVLLGRHGIQTDLKIGVAHEPGNQLAGHAWLERQGEAILGAPQPERFRPLEHAREPAS